MDSDIKLDSNVLRLEGDSVAVAGTDLVLDNLARRRPGTDPRAFRRALVHDFGDALTINYNGDYPDGVSVQGPRLNVSGNINATGINVSGDMSVSDPGSLSATRIFLLDFEVDVVASPSPGTPVMKSIELAQEIHRLRDVIDALTRRVAALEAK